MHYHILLILIILLVCSLLGTGEAFFVSSKRYRDAEISQRGFENTLHSELKQLCDENGYGNYPGPAGGVPYKVQGICPAFRPDPWNQGNVGHVGKVIDTIVSYKCGLFPPSHYHVGSDKMNDLDLCEKVIEAWKMPCPRWAMTKCSVEKKCDLYPVPLSLSIKKEDDVVCEDVNRIRGERTWLYRVIMWMIHKLP